MGQIPPDLAPRLGMYGQADILQQSAWAPLGAKLRTIYSQLARVPGVPGAWLDQVNAELNGGHLVRPVPTRPGGVRRSDLPPWLVGPLMDVWDSVAETARKTTFAYANGQREAGLKEVEAAIRNAAFWDAAYRTAVAIRDAPKDAVGAVLDGVGNVGFGLIGTLLKSPVVWVGAAVAVVMFIGPGKVARAALSKVK